MSKSKILVIDAEVESTWFLLVSYRERRRSHLRVRPHDPRILPSTATMAPRTTRRAVLEPRHRRRRHRARLRRQHRRHRALRGLPRPARRPAVRVHSAVPDRRLSRGPRAPRRPRRDPTGKHLHRLLRRRPAAHRPGAGNRDDQRVRHQVPGRPTRRHRDRRPRRRPPTGRRGARSRKPASAASARATSHRTTRSTTAPTTSAGSIWTRAGRFTRCRPHAERASDSGCTRTAH